MLTAHLTKGTTMGAATAPRANLPAPPRALRIAVIAIAVAAQLVVLVPFTVASGLLAPLWAIVSFYALWLVGAVILVRLARRQPFATPLVPIVNAAVLFGAITLGEGLLGWTA